MKTNRQSYPSTKPISIVQGRLARGIQGQEGSIDNNTSTETEVSRERTIMVPGAALNEYGGSVPATPSMRRAMFAKLVRSGRYNKDTVWTHRAIFEHKPFEFVKDSIEGMTMDKISPTFLRNMEEQLSKIPNLEVTIGN
jgi:hypothetical protein